MRKLDSSIRYFLVQKLRISNAEAAEWIYSGKVKVNSEIVTVHYKLQPTDTIVLDGEVLRAGMEFTYLAFYKPRGIETTLNKEIPDNLHTSIELQDNMVPVGRLDKESEGLLIISNDGRIFNRILMSHNKQDKEYRVKTNQDLTEFHIQKLAHGIEIMGKTTLPAKVNKLADKEFTITLTEGRNRQIRRMCYKLGLEVEQLIRTRMLQIELGNLCPGEFRILEKQEISILLESIGLR